MRGDPGAQHAQLLDELERRRRVGIDGHPSMVSRIANLSKLDVALVIEADGNMNMHAELGSARRRWPPSTPPGARTSPWAAP
ncbi:MAG TPA: hypothetical protein VII33_01880 [Nakamurella sp.]